MLSELIFDSNWYPKSKTKKQKQNNGKEGMIKNKDSKNENSKEKNREVDDDFFLKKMSQQVREREREREREKKLTGGKCLIYNSVDLYVPSCSGHIHTKCVVVLTCVFLFWPCTQTV